MHLSVGDLVQTRRDNRLGILVEKRTSNESSWIPYGHSVYYVLFPDSDSVSGPYFSGDLMLKQQLQ
jgi:hypothetical protein